MRKHDLRPQLNTVSMENYTKYTSSTNKQKLDVNATFWDIYPWKVVLKIK